MTTRITHFVMPNGERYCLLCESPQRVPCFYPNLFITSQVRNRSLSLSAMRHRLAALAVFMAFLSHKNMSHHDLEVRFHTLAFLSVNEIDELADMCQRNFYEHQSAFPLPRPTARGVAKQTTYIRLTYIADYLRWLASLLLQRRREKEVRKRIEEMHVAITSRRPPTRHRNQLQEKGLSAQQSATLLEVLRPASPLNPYASAPIRARNQVMLLLLYYLGLRGGELLNIRISDIDFQACTLTIARRPDAPGDPRPHQPLVKTRDRLLPVSSSLIQHIHHYITTHRRGVKGAKRHDYLFVTHKQGAHAGQPLSLSAYKRVIMILRAQVPFLQGFTAHQLRHTWNERLSEQFDAMARPPSEAEQESIRSYLMGWQDGSGTASIYNKRFIRRLSERAALHLQAGLLATPGAEGSGHEH